MKKLLLASFSLSVALFSAQPVISNLMSVPQPGFSASVSIASTTNPGAAGANQTWNFSALPFSNIGTMNVIQPSSSTMYSSFPTANYAYTLSGTTSFFETSATKMEVLAYSITSPGSGNDYSPNPRTMFKFPFAFGDTAFDYWQKVGGSVNTVLVTYDGYGTLITPTATYNNVVRLREDYGNGSDYQWYLTNPLMPIMVFDHNNNMMYSIGVVPTGIEDLSYVPLKVYPNPASGQVHFSIPEYKATNASVLLFDAVGRMLLTTKVSTPEVMLDVSNISSGIYYYELRDEGRVLNRGKLVVEL